MPALAESELIYRTEDVELHLPGSWAEKILIQPTLNGATFYQKASYDKFMEEKGLPGGGYLFTLGGCVNSDFENLPSFIYLGFCEDSAMNYYLELPTDYPAYMDDEIRAEWDDMHKMMRGIAQGAVIRESDSQEDSYDVAPPTVFTSKDYDYTVFEDAATIVKYNGNDKNIEIPAEIDGYPVTELGAEAFSYLKLNSVSIPDSILLIGQRAFEYCEITDAFRLPENVTIAVDAFSYAKLPVVVTIPAGARVEKCAFSYCEKVERVMVEPEATIKGRAFEYCDDLESVVCAGGAYLEKGAFAYCRRMKQAILCGDVEAEESAFSNCGDLEVTNAEADEYDALKQSALDGSLGQSTDSSPDEAEEIVLEIINSPATLEGVTVTLEKATAVKNQKPDGFTYTFTGTLENNSDEGIMKVIYTFSLIDVNGEEYRSFGEVYDGEDAALPAHTTIEFNLDDVKWGPQSIPAAVEIGVSSVQTEAELPPVHLPQTGEYLYQALGNEKLANIREEMPVELSFHVDQGGYGRTATIKAGDALDKAIDFFCDIKIGAESGEWVTDNYNWIDFTWADGSHTGISLNLYNLEYYAHSTPHTYELENLDAFWSYCAGYLQEDG